MSSDEDSSYEQPEEDDEEEDEDEEKEDDDEDKEVGKEFAMPNETMSIFSDKPIKNKTAAAADQVIQELFKNKIEKKKTVVKVQELSPTIAKATQSSASAPIEILDSEEKSKPTPRKRSRKPPAEPTDTTIIRRRRSAPAKKIVSNSTFFAYMKQLAEKKMKADASGVPIHNSAIFKAIPSIETRALVLEQVRIAMAAIAHHDITNDWQTAFKTMPDPFDSIGPNFDWMSAGAEGVRKNVPNFVEVFRNIYDLFPTPLGVQETQKIPMNVSVDDF